MSRFDVRERDVPRLLDVVTALHEPSGDVTPNLDAGWGAPVELLCADPTGPGIPWRSLELLRDLLHVEVMCLQALDTERQAIYFGQETGIDGPEDYWCDFTAAGDPLTPASSVPDDVLAGETLFWETYWDHDCSYPDASGDWVTIRCSQHAGRRDALELARKTGSDISHDIVAATPIGSGRHLRLLGWRDGWGEYDERTQGFLELLKPHLMSALRASWRTDPPITPSQRRVLALVGRGDTNRQVARELGITEATVRTHLQHAYAALGVTNRVAAVAAAFDSPIAGHHSPLPG